MKDLLSRMAGMYMLGPPTFSDSWIRKGPEYECMACGVGITKEEGVVDASEGAPLFGWFDADDFLPELLKTHSLLLDTHLEHGSCLSHLTFDSVHDAQDLRRVRFDLSPTLLVHQ
jgi:hypothetical protein